MRTLSGLALLSCSLVLAACGRLPASPTPDGGAAEAQTLASSGTTYFISPSGDDHRAGTSRGGPWRSIEKVNATSFQPGDRILFEGGQTFAGNLSFTEDDVTAAGRPITVGSYGRGRATLQAGTGSGIFVHNRGGFRIRDLAVRGPGGEANRGDGISFYNDLPGGVKLEHVRIERVDVSGFRGSGIVIGAYPEDKGKSGYRDVRITSSRSHDNLDAGISTYGYSSNGTIPGDAHENVYVGYCETDHNRGIAGRGNNSGNGIVLGDVDGAVVERSVAHDNGENNDHLGGGPVGIWAYESNDVTIQFNESYRNRTGTIDGGGFDLDGGVTNSVMQYNYSHDNAGAGFLLYQFSGARPFRNNTVHYNVSQNDGQKGEYGGIYAGGGVRDVDVYGNTVFVSPVPGADPRALRIEEGSDNIRVRNNIFFASVGARLLSVVPGATGLTFQGNAYWSGGGPVTLDWGGTTYPSLAAWREATGQERLSGTDVGLSADPRLVAPGQGPTFGNADLLPALAAYVLRPDSPLIDAGIDLRAVGVEPGGRDFYGLPVPRGRVLDVGANEFPFPAVRH